MLHEYYTDTTKHCEQEVNSIEESFEVAKTLIKEKELLEVKIITPNDTFFVRPPKVRKKKSTTTDKV